jgi:hypothetical protein
MRSFIETAVLIAASDSAVCSSKKVSDLYLHIAARWCPAGFP